MKQKSKGSQSSSSTIPKKIATSRKGGVRNDNEMQNSSQDQKYNPNEIETKWQKIWEEKGVYKPNLDTAKKPFYNLMMFPYPSAEGMHVGNMYAFTGSDIYGRFKRMQGYDVFEPIGLDGFGIHSENYAIKVGKHPKEQAEISQKNFYRQLRSIGNGFDWGRTVETYDPNYYKWTQWIFIQLFKKGLAYRKKAPVNFCPSCKTVLADEQVIDGKCERCSSVVEKRQLSQWFFRITEYADALLDGLSRIDWTEKVKIAQREWIGRSVGAQIEFKIQNSKFKIEVFTTALDTIYGVTFLVISPEHPFIKEITSQDKKEEVQNYINQAQKKSELERTSLEKEKTGIFTGAYVINPFTGENVPVWVADYVLINYGTGAVMGVPGHDARDHEFAIKYGLSIKPVIKPTAKAKGAQLEKDGFWDYQQEIKTKYSHESVLFDSGEFSGLSSREAKKKIEEYAKANSLGKKVTTYHLRDWLISRQRYWGPPIPMIYCEVCAGKGISYSSSVILGSKATPGSDSGQARMTESSMPGWFPVSEDQLPVLLPDVEDWRPEGTGTAPLANHPEFYNTICPNCGGKARRETDVSDTFLDSSWYFLRYIATDCNSMPFPSEGFIKPVILNGVKNPRDPSAMPQDDIVQRARWLPVSMYIGGAEHSVLHLLYTRFLWKVFKDLGYFSAKGRPASGWDEPFPRFFAHGLIIKDGAKMSKSKGNVVVPDEYIRKYGSDTVRTYLMFSGPFSQGGDFRDSGVEGMYRFLKRVYKLVLEYQSSKIKAQSSNKKDDEILDRAMHAAIKKVTEDLASLHYNTAIAAIMEYYNELTSNKSQVTSKYLEVLLLLLAPFAPHMTEELYYRINADGESADIRRFDPRKSIHVCSLPTYDPKMLQQDEVTIVVQVNGKVREAVKVQSSKIKDQKEIEEKVCSLEKVKKYLDGKKIEKIVYIPGKIISYSVTD